MTKDEMTKDEMTKDEMTKDEMTKEAARSIGVIVGLKRCECQLHSQPSVQA